MKIEKLSVLLILIFTQISLAFGQNQIQEDWKIARETELLAEDGWINLAGLFWIDDENAFLNRIGNDILTISNKTDESTVGSFQFKKDSVWFLFNPNLIKESKKQNPAKILQFPEKEYGSGSVYFDRWKWTVINRGGQYAMRLRDLKHPGLSQFEPIPYFEYDSTFSLQAKFIPKFNETINIPNVLGQVIEWKVMGILQFEIDDKKFELTAVDEARKLFVIFSDLTNESETYPTGRYMYVSYPDRNGNTKIDFNFSYNPPCAFTAFATCPIPPKVNRLEIAIKAGEKEPLGHK